MGNSFVRTGFEVADWIQEMAMYTDSLDQTEVTAAGAKDAEAIQLEEATCAEPDRCG